MFFTGTCCQCAGASDGFGAGSDTSRARGVDEEPKNQLSNVIPELRCRLVPVEEQSEFPSEEQRVSVLSLARMNEMGEMLFP